MSHNVEDRLPAGWTWTTLGDVALSNINQSGPDGDEFLYVDISSIDNRTKRIVAPKRLRSSEAPSRARQRLQPLDVLVSMTRPNLNAVALMPQSLSDAVGSTGFHVLRANRLEPRWLFYLVQTPAFVEEMSGVVQGALYPAVRPKDITGYRIPLAPLQEQRRIVSEIEEQLTRLDAAVAALERTQTNLKRYRASVLKASVEGRLVPTEAELAGAEGRDYEPADQLLVRILKKRRACWEASRVPQTRKAVKRPNGAAQRRYMAPAEPNTNGLPALPKGWAWATLEQLSERVTVGHVGPMRHEYVVSGIPFLRSQNVRENRFEPAGLLHISREFHQSLLKSQLRPGDIVIVRSGSVGVSCVVPNHLSEANCSDLVIVQRPLGIVPEYGAYFMNSAAKRRVKAGKVGIALAHFNTKSVARLVMAVPPLAEQRRIAEEVERRLSIVAQLEEVVRTSLVRAAMLRSTILVHAFEGKLAPQDPSDEPASVLLERI